MVAFSDAFQILLREGLEAMLVIAALTALLHERRRQRQSQVGLCGSIARDGFELRCGLGVREVLRRRAQRFHGSRRHGDRRPSHVLHERVAVPATGSKGLDGGIAPLRRKGAWVRDCLLARRHRVPRRVHGRAARRSSCCTRPRRRPVVGIWAS